MVNASNVGSIGEDTTVVIRIVNGFSLQRIHPPKRSQALSAIDFQIDSFLLRARHTTVFVLIGNGTLARTFSITLYLSPDIRIELEAVTGANINGELIQR